MEYTYQEKCVAAIECKLWWRFPDSLDSGERNWSLITDDVTNVVASDLRNPDAEYHIGDDPPKPPRVLSELERELLETLDEAMSMLGSRLIKDTFGYEWHEKAAAAIAKAKGEA